MTVFIFFGLFLIALSRPLFSQQDYIELTMENNNTNIECHVDDKLEVILAGQPTTGHIWQNYYIEGNAILEDGASYYVRNHTNPGSNGIYHFPYIATQVGHSRLRLTEGRSWEDNPLNIFYVTFTVTKAQ